MTLAGDAGALRAQESPIVLATPTGEVHGTLLMPAASGPVPVALVIAGSGPTDRDGNSPLLMGKNNSLKMVADALAAMGVASVRYDKRGIGASMAAATKESDLRFTHYVDDAAAWVAKLAADSRFSGIAIVGHSEGALIGTIAAGRGNVARVVSIAGAGRPIAETLDEQLSRNLAGSPLLEESRRIIRELQSGREVAQVPPQLGALFRPSVQPYLISWLPIDPAAEVGRLRIPVLVVQGTTDLQVTRVDAERLVAGNANTQLIIIDGMNHILKDVRDPQKQAASYSDPTLPLHPALVVALERFFGKR